jgi:uncharacterized protein
VIALDTNLLVYAHRSATSEHKAARAAIERAADSDGWGFAAPVVAEFSSIVTHPAASGWPSSPDEARRFLAALADAGAHVWSPGAGFGLRLAQLAADADRAMCLRGWGTGDLESRRPVRNHTWASARAGDSIARTIR